MIDDVKAGSIEIQLFCRLNIQHLANFDYSCFISGNDVEKEVYFEEVHSNKR